ncbi:Hypothetical predicted protein, partial [Pelobates cultripes]
MTERFLERGYQRPILDKALIEEKLHRVQKEASITQRMFFPTTFHRSSPQISSIIRNNWRILAADDTLPKVFQEQPLICFKRNRNLKDLLVYTDPNLRDTEKNTPLNR